MRLPRLLVIAGVATLGACSLSTDLPTSRPLGVVVVTDTVDGSGNTVVSPIAHFFNGQGVVVPDSRVVVDSCVVIPNLADTGAFPYQLFTPLNAGDSVIVQTGGISASLFPEIDPTTQLATGQYDLHEPPIPFTPGDPISVTVPGATGGGSYPSGATSAATSAPYTVAPIDRAPNPDSFNISWSPAAGNGSAVVFVLAFDTAASSPAGNPLHIELYCSDTDTGTLHVPASVARLWLKALPGPRNMRSYRWVTTIQNNGGAGLIVISQHNEYAADAP